MRHDKRILHYSKSWGPFPVSEYSFLFSGFLATCPPSARGASFLETLTTSPPSPLSNSTPSCMDFFVEALNAPCAEIDKKKCAGHRSTPIYEQSSAPPLKAPRGLQGGPLQSESIHSSLDIFKGSGHQKSESVFREFILRLELLSANYITTHLKLLSYSFECL